MTNEKIYRITQAVCVGVIEIGLCAVLCWFVDVAIDSHGTGAWLYRGLLAGLVVFLFNWSQEIRASIRRSRTNEAISDVLKESSERTKAALAEVSKL